MGWKGPFLCLSLPLAACASTPDVTVQYFPAKSLTTFAVTQNVACTHDDMTLIVTSAVTAAMEYSADQSQPPHSIRVKDLDNDFADTSLAVNLFGDGRLKSINATSTGEGQAVISAAAGLAGAFAPALGSSPGRGPQKLAVCAVLKNWSGGKAALTFAKSIDLAQLPAGGAVPLNDDLAAVNDPLLYARLAYALPNVTLEVSEKTPVPRPAIGAGEPRNAIALTLRDTSQVKTDFYATGGPGGRHWLGAKIFVVPGPGDYMLPMPKAAPFGGEQFSLTLSESGAVTSLSYGKTSGAPAVLGAVTSAATVITPSAAPAAPAAVQ